MRFKNQRFVTKGVCSNIGIPLQFFMWQCIDDLDCEKDYLQIFKFTMSDEKQKVTHIQENPEYKTEYLLNADAPFFVGKIYVIDNGQYSTMLLADEY